MIIVIGISNFGNFAVEKNFSTQKFIICVYVRINSHDFV